VNIAIMQPYFVPYIGYFQLINMVDTFVIYDDVEYVKQSWINRNRILVNGEPKYISLPLKKDSDFLDVRNRYLAESWGREKKKLLLRIKGAYAKAPYFNSVFELLSLEVFNEKNCLSDFLITSIKSIMVYLYIDTPIVISSELGDYRALKSQDKVLSICRNLNATKYINSLGGKALYQKKAFAENNIDLMFLQSRCLPYNQNTKEFQSFLSIVDVLMFNSRESIKTMLETDFDLIYP